VYCNLTLFDCTVAALPSHKGHAHFAAMSRHKKGRETMSLPDLPVIDSINWAPPAESDHMEVVRRTMPLIIRGDADNSSHWDNVWDIEKKGQNVSPRLNNWWGPDHTPAGHQFVLRQYWKLVPGTFLHLMPGTRVQKTWQYTHGISTTDSQSITAQVGISADGISAGLSTTLSHSVTINDQQTETTEYSVDPPPSGTRVWALWDLTYEFIIAHSGTVNPIPAGTYRGDVDFHDDDHYSGAYLNYNWTYKTVSAGILCAHDKVFNT
jgi:hypothetical protein